VLPQKFVTLYLVLWLVVSGSNSWTFCLMKKEVVEEEKVEVDQLVALVVNEERIDFAFHVDRYLQHVTDVVMLIYAGMLSYLFLGYLKIDYETLETLGTLEILNLKEI
jgi:hypothetical protein